MARLIDANALITQIQGTASEVAANAPYEPLWFTRLAARQFEIIDIIKHRPTVDAVEVVHGRWEDVSLRFTQVKEKCTVCGGIVYAHGFNYCPNCGAKMDGERRTDNG
jgi:tRNA(Ile2) C34 agmatinyltransferase TiaS